MSACVYRIRDTSGDLLYVGVSAAAMKRLTEHARSQPWWRDAAHVDLEHFDSRFEAMVAEARAIRDEHPRHNEIFPPTPVRPWQVGAPAGARTRLDHALTGRVQAHVARDLGVSSSQLAMWRRGAFVPAVRTRERIATYLGLDVDYLWPTFEAVA